MYHDTDKCDLEAGQRRLNCRLRPNCLPWVLHSMGPMASSGLLLPYCPFPSAPLALAPLSCRHSAACKPHCKPISARRLTIGYRKKGGGAKGVARTPLRSQAPLPFHFLLCPSPCVSSEQAGKLEFFHVPAKISLLAQCPVSSAQCV